MATITWPQGNTNQPLALTLESADGTVTNLSGVAASAITLSLQPAIPLGLFAPCGGTTTIVSATAGTITYQFAAADVAVSGIYQLAVHVAYTGSEGAYFTFPFIIMRTV